MTWDPQQYQKFEEFRLRAGHDLIARIPMDTFRVIYDLGCGTGQLTRLLQRYWPNARITGIDDSAEMLAIAKQEPSSIIWEQQNILRWKPQEPADLIFSNAMVQWLPQHEKLFPGLLNYLKPDGVLAIQMSNNFAQPSHRSIYEAANAGPWKKTLAPLLFRPTILSPPEYYALFAPLTRYQDIWQTIYYHPLAGENPILEWVRGTFMKPLLDALKESERKLFIAEYLKRIGKVYQKQIDDVTLFPFNRLFIVVQI